MFKAESCMMKQETASVKMGVDPQIVGCSRDEIVLEVKRSGLLSHASVAWISACRTTNKDQGDGSASKGACRVSLVTHVKMERRQAQLPSDFHAHTMVYMTTLTYYLHTHTHTNKNNNYYDVRLQGGIGKMKFLRVLYLSSFSVC